MSKREVSLWDIEIRMLNYATIDEGHISGTFLHTYSSYEYLQMLRKHIYRDTWEHLTDEKLTSMICQILSKRADEELRISTMSDDEFWDSLLLLGDE